MSRILQNLLMHLKSKEAKPEDIITAFRCVVDSRDNEMQAAFAALREYRPDLAEKIIQTSNAFHLGVASVIVVMAEEIILFRTGPAIKIILEDLESRFSKSDSVFSEEAMAEVSAELRVKIYHSLSPIIRKILSGEDLGDQEVSVLEDIELERFIGAKERLAENIAERLLILATRRCPICPYYCPACDYSELCVQKKEAFTCQLQRM